MTTRTPADDDLLLEATEAFETTDGAVGAGRDGLEARLLGADPALQAVRACAGARADGADGDGKDKDAFVLDVDNVDAHPAVFALRESRRKDQIGRAHV